MKNIIEFIKNNKLYCLILFVGLILLGIQVNQVVMYADDYTLGIYSNESGFQGAIDYFVYNYFHWGGGFTGLIVISILAIGFKLWLFLEVFFILAMVLITMKLVNLKDGKYKELFAIIVWSLYFIININTSRETILWLDGSIAYVFTSLQVLFYTYLIYTRMHYPNMRKKYDYVIFPLTAFFGGWSSAQSGAMVVLISIIVWLFAKYINKEKIPKFYLYSSVLTLIGYCIFFFAPGNSARMSTTEMFASLGFFSKMLFTVDTFYAMFFDFKFHPYFGMPFYTFFIIIILLLVTKHLAKSEKNEKLKFVLNLSVIYNLMYLLLAIIRSTPLVNDYPILEYFFTFKNLYNLLLAHELSPSHLLSYGVATITVIAVAIQTLYFSIKKKDSLFLLLMAIGFASQVVMLMAPYHPYRTTFITIMVFIIGIIYLMKYILEEDIEWEYYLSGLLLVRLFPIGVCLLALFYLTKKYLKDNKVLQLRTINLIIFVSLLAGIGFCNWGVITLRYRNNKVIDEENMERIEEYKKSPNEEKILVLVAPENELYGSTPLAGVDWVETDVILYFELDKNTDIMFEEEYHAYIEKNKETSSELVESNE